MQQLQSPRIEFFAGCCIVGFVIPAHVTEESAAQG
jgi:hypothetical protein